MGRQSTPVRFNTMPNYEFLCPQCGDQFEKLLPMAEYKTPQPCPCGSLATRILSMPNFILKGDDWVGKNIKIKGQMADKYNRLGKRQEEMKRDAPGMTLAPNVDGERVGSWSEAQKLAQSKGKATGTYDDKIREEKTKKK